MQDNASILKGYLETIKEQRESIKKKKKIAGLESKLRNPNSELDTGQQRLLDTMLQDNSV